MKPTNRLTVSLFALALLAFHPRLAGQTTSTTPTVTTLHSFTGAAGIATLILGSDGNLYGTTQFGGSSASGTVFKLTPAGKFTALHTFTGSGTDGAQPEGALVQGSDGNFYGTTREGGTGNGTVFKITPAGKFTLLYSFMGNGTDGVYPTAGLVQGKDGNFYGTTEGGGMNSAGAVFKVTPAGMATTIYSFINNSLGDATPSTLIQGSDGNFYGTTFYGGIGLAEEGTIYKITPAGEITPLHIFVGGTDGEYPAAALVQGKDGNFYGTTQGFFDNVGNYGTAFKITPAGVFTFFHHFTGNGEDGAAPTASLIQGGDGTLYGTTPDGGSDGFGTIYQMTPAGVLTTIHSFTGLGTEGVYPQTALVQGGNGTYYGTTEYGGSSDAGTVFRLTVPISVITSPDTATATVGAAFSYQITASNYPTSYGALGLPPGLKVDARTGLISGTPTAAGKKTITLKVNNAGGTGTASMRRFPSSPAPPPPPPRLANPTAMKSRRRTIRRATAWLDWRTA